MVDMREWMIALGILVVVAVALDCVRRIRSASKDSLQLATNMKRGLADRVDPLEEDRDVLGVRVSPRSQLDEDDPLFDTATPRLELSDTGRRLDLGQAVPLLVDVNDTQRIEPAFDEDEEDAAAVTQPVPVMDEDLGLEVAIREDPRAEAGGVRDGRRHLGAAGGEQEDGGGEAAHRGLRFRMAGRGY